MGVASPVQRRGPDDLWSLVGRAGPIDEQDLWQALGQIAPDADLDYRTRLLAHDALQALENRWGRETLQHRLAGVVGGEGLGRLWNESFDEVGFASLRHRLVQATSSQSILQLLRELGGRIVQPASIDIGGSTSLLLADLIVRRTEDIDVVDEVPAAVRADPQLVDELAARYGLRLTHFASHYLPNGWQQRLRSLGSFGKLEARVIDPLDVLCGKLFSRRTKDLDDLRTAFGRIDEPSFQERVCTSTARLRADQGLAEAARQNWYILTGQQSLP